jgi:hypothetical protein
VVNTFGVGEAVGAGSSGGSTGGEAAVRDAVVGRRPEEAIALALGSELGSVARGLSQAALEDRAGSFIVVAHLIKTAEAAGREAAELASPLPLAATARYLAAPRLERFVARNVAQSIDFIRTGRPPRR